MINLGKGIRDKGRMYYCNMAFSVKVEYMGIKTIVLQYIKY